MKPLWRLKGHENKEPEVKAQHFWKSDHFCGDSCVWKYRTWTLFQTNKPVSIISGKFCWALKTTALDENRTGFTPSVKRLLCLESCYYCSKFQYCGTVTSKVTTNCGVYERFTQLLFRNYYRTTATLRTYVAEKYRVTYVLTCANR